MTGGVVRRDGLRWQRLAADNRIVAGGWLDADGCFVLRVPDDKPYRVQIEARPLDAVPGPSETSDGPSGDLASKSPTDVPPDPPAVDSDELARWFARYNGDTDTFENPDLRSHPVNVEGRRDYRRQADALLSSGVLVAAADVRARAEQAALQMAHEAVHEADVRRYDGPSTRDHVREAISDYATREPSPTAAVTLAQAWDEGYMQGTRDEVNDVQHEADNPYTDRAVSEREGADRDND